MRVLVVFLFVFLFLFHIYIYLVMRCIASSRIDIYKSMRWMNWIDFLVGWEYDEII